MKAGRGHMSGAVSIWQLARQPVFAASGKTRVQRSFCNLFLLILLFVMIFCALMQKCYLSGIWVACLHPVSLGSQLSNYHLDKTEVAHCSLFGTLPLRQKHCHSLCPTGKTSQNVTKHHITCFAFIPRKIHSTIFENFDHQTP